MLLDSIKENDLRGLKDMWGKGVQERVLNGNDKVILRKDFSTSP
jgi:hypothetical protein